MPYLLLSCSFPLMRLYLAVKGIFIYLCHEVFFIVIRMCLPRNAAKCSGDFYICNANILRTFNNTGVRSDMRPGFFYLGQKRPKFAFSFQSG